MKLCSNSQLAALLSQPSKITVPSPCAYVVSIIGSETESAVLFPDAPTERGVKHLNELAALIEQGYEAHMVFVIQMQGVRYFVPNYMTYAAFGEALVAAKAQGVQVVALDCTISENSLNINDSVPVKLSSEYEYHSCAFHADCT